MLRIIPKTWRNHCLPSLGSAPFRRLTEGIRSAARGALVLRRSGPPLAVFCGLLIGLATPAIRLQAEEPVEAFLTALRERGYFELAIAYLERHAAGSLASPEFRQILPYEQGVTLIQAALAQRQLSQKLAYLDRAQSEFERFREQQPEHPLRLSADVQLGKLLVERARLELLRAERPGVNAKEREQIVQQSRDLFDEARDVFQQNQTKIRSRLEQFPAGLAAERDADRIRERDQLRADYVEAQFIAAMTRYEQAQTYPADHEEARRNLKEAEEAFGVVAEKYRRRIAGLSAVLFQGRCRQDMGDVRGALGFYEELLTLPDGEPALRPVKTKALRQAMDCWLSPELQQVELAIDKAESWLADQRPDEVDQPDWLALELRLAEAYLELAETNSSTRDKTRLLNDARRLAVEVAKHPGESQEQAQELLAQFGQAVTLPTSQVDATTFAEAMQAGQEILSQRQVAAGTVALLTDRILQISDPQQRREAEERLQTAQAQLAESDQKALVLFEQARQLADEDTPLEELNLARFYLCTLHYYAKNYYESAVLASFLSRYFPESVEGRRAGAVALASLVQLYGDGTAPEAASLIDEIRHTAENLVRRYPGQPEAEDALGTLITLSVQAGRLKEAEQYLDQLPEDSSKRGLAELALGQALWNQSFAKGPDGKPTVSEATEDSLRTHAQELLSRGLEHSQAGSISPAHIAAALSLAQNALRENKPKQALELLEHPRYGPQLLAAQKHPLMQSDDLTQRAYTLALLAYVAELPEATAPDEVVTKAMAALEALKSVYGDDPAGRKQLAATYLALAQSVREQIESTPPEGRATLSAAFEQFLERAAAATTEESVLNWVAESYLGLARGLATPEDGIPAEGQAYVDKAIAIYESLLQRSRSTAQPPDANAQLAAESRLAAAYREAGRYAEAVDRFAQILQQQPNQVYVQFEAARTLQQWGDRGNAPAYRAAIQGDRPDPATKANRIWGYGRLARIVASSSALRDLFYDSRYRLAECRYRHALQQPAGQRTKELAAAERDIVMTARLYPDLGGPQQKARFDQLLREIQKSQGKKPTGLP